jgi:hypothetical protein
MFGCSAASITAVKMTYHDGEESKLDVVLLNSGNVDLAGFRIYLYDDNGLAEEVNQFEDINVSDVIELDIDLGSNNYLHENNTINMIRIAPKISGETCDAKSVYDFKLVEHEDED